MRKFLNETTFHGLTQLDTKEPGKHKLKNACWTLIFIGFTVVVVRNITLILNDFYHWPTTISYEFREVLTKSIPANVKVCTPYRWSARRIQALGISDRLLETIDALFDLSVQVNKDVGLAHYPFSPTGGFDDVETFLNGTRAEYEDLMRRNNLSRFDELVIRMNFQCQDLFESCSLGLKIPKKGSPYDCCPPGHVAQLLPNVGLCFALPKVWLTPGESRNKIRVVFRFPSNLTEIGRFRQSSIIDVVPVPGVVSLLQQDSGHAEAISTDPKSSLIGLFERGRHYVVAMNERIIESVKSPDYECVEGDPRVSNYSVTECMMDCVNLRFSCECRIPMAYAGVFNSSTERIIATSGNRPLCSPWAVRKCAGQQSMKEVRHITNCASKCPSFCYSVRYTFNIVHAAIDPITVGFIRNDSEAYIGRTAVADFYLRQNYTMASVQTFSMGLSTLASYIGGQSGLWIGGSVLSFVHFITFLLASVWQWISDKCCAKEADFKN